MRIPVIRGKIGDWGYYSGVMTFEQIASVVEPSVNKFHTPSYLSDVLQRDLTDNYKSIKEYLQKDEQRFFNAIVLAIYDGDPKWLEVEFDDEYEEVYNVGFLAFNEDVKIFPVDGQHRVAGIKAVLEESPELAEEQVPVIFIAHKNTDEGKRRTRKLFSTLNRRAKPVGENSQIALDEDDINSIITRELIEKLELFQGDRLCNNKGKQVHPGNKKAITSLVAFYQCNSILVQDELNLKGKKYKEFLLYRPNDEIIENAYKHVYKFWTAFCNHLNIIKDYMERKDTSPYRNSSGGNILFRPVALIEFVKACILISTRTGKDFDDIMQKMNDISMNLSEFPWSGVFWDGSKIINRVNLSLMRYLIVHMSFPEVLSTDEYVKMIELYAVATNTQENKEEVEKMFK